MTTLMRWRPSDIWAPCDWNPSAELVETPGMKTEDVQVTLSGDVLTLKGEKRQGEKREEEHWHGYERSHGAFQRSFALQARPGAGVRTRGLMGQIERRS